MKSSAIERQNRPALLYGASLVAAATLTATTLIMIDPRPVLSQVVELLKVDVATVAKGYRTTKLVGSSVVNEKNVKIGTIDDIVLAIDGNVFPVLQVGSFLGLGGRLVAVPYSSLVITESGKRIELPGASADALRKLVEVKYGT
jgi:hypothetical protein